MLDARAIKAIPLVLLPSTLGFAQQVQANSAGSAASQNTAFVSCDQHKPKHVVSPVRVQRTTSITPMLKSMLRQNPDD